MNEETKGILKRMTQRMAIEMLDDDAILVICRGLMDLEARTRNTDFLLVEKTREMQSVFYSEVARRIALEQKRTNKDE